MSTNRSAPHVMSGHAAGQRGLTRATRSELREGRFGRMFRTASASWGHDSVAKLMALGDAMVSTPDPPKDGTDAEESGIPALYTYFGQFVDHDITFDPVSLLTKASDPDGLVDFRTPALDLDNIYGRGPADQPYMFDGLKFRLGDPLLGQGVAGAHDLPRLGGRAVIGDPRNDENAIVSQLQGIVHRFHNRMVDDNPGLSFEQVQERVRFHYQYVVVHDFLRRIVADSVLADLKNSNGRYAKSKLEFFHWRNKPFMPVEFSVAAYRFGHSMVRPGYRLNDDDATLLPIFTTDGGPTGLSGFRVMTDGRAIDWGRFVETEVRAFGMPDPVVPPVDAPTKRRLQLAYRIDTSLVDPLGHLPASVAGDPPPSLAQRNLIRGFQLGLPSGQQVAAAMGIAPLADAEILIGKAVDVVDPADPALPINEIAGGAFAGKCPLWTYVLAEAAATRTWAPTPATGGPATTSTPQLGPVGGRIVAEVLLGLMFGDKTSMLSLDPAFTPVTGPGFELKDLVSYALGMGVPLH